MTIALPPPLPPQETDIADIADRGAAAATVGAYRLHLPQTPRLPARTLRAAVDGAMSVDELLHGLARAYYEQGLLSAQLRYALDGDDVYVLVEQRRVAEVRAPRVLMPYFEPLVGAPLNERTFEKRRALANVQAERAGIEAQTQLEETPNGLVLDIEQEGGRRDTSSARAEIWNPGNRFVGRNFLDLDLRHSNVVGDQFKLLWHTALTWLGDANADHFNEETLTWSRATAFGAIGLTGHAFDYRGEDDLDGQLRELQAAWLYPVAATLRSRWLLDVRVEYTHEQRDLRPEDAIVTQREEYPSLQIGTHYSRSGAWAGRPLDADLSLTARQGLRGGESGSGADLGYLLGRASASFNLKLSDAFDAGLALAGQYSGDSLPEQSQWVLGGIDNVAAYLPGIAVGDSGAYASLDLQYAGWRVADLQLKPRVFAEYGYSRLANDAGLPAIQLADVGAELRANWRFAEASLAAAMPVQHSGVADDLRRRSEANLLFRVAARF
ncbi:ShlB/FhaC/HecB family hemolysin secretion/activation protein [Solimonas soli]|uniref:ShlB/FhaC/HecB family hemolysin secretion/activation protein n=1 Tax=Solimonas soli TaxID=413479 RepID=UPI0004880876|nr:ShlB/FhaC/HecB family hemolysin secretion/activation protein [Solimonas soli]